MTNGTDLHDVRRDYHGDELDLQRLADAPMVALAAWLEEALQVMGHDANAVNLATIGQQGQPRSRMVLVKAINADGCHFFTNYDSAKGNELSADPRAAMTIYWSALDRQVRLEGSVERLPARVSADYFARRPRGSQLAAAASAQSHPLASRQALLDRYQTLAQEIGAGPVPTPPTWGGYVLRPTWIEFWQGMPSRLHDRVVLQLRAEGAWQGQRLMP